MYQQFQDYILQPRITARTVDVNPAVALLAVLAGGALFGAVGALLVIPARVTTGLYVRRYDVADDPRIERTARKPRSAKRFRRPEK
ncbi:AI-2E family transporter [Nocardia sp. CA-135398]|uniref:AI-2E family transporter n=1 Tax=Nocardia sp. CA-135398 TaxID=3239977 RepID=UPI003D992ED8